MGYPYNKCVILGIDPGKISGWAIIVRGNYIDGGIAQNHIERKDALIYAKYCSNEVYELPLIIAYEKWSPGWQKGKRSFQSIIGTGASWGAWQAVLEDAEIPKSHMFGIYPNTWRRAILGLRPGRYSREQAKQAAIALFNHHSSTGCSDHNEAEAYCIAYYCVYFEEVTKLLSKISEKP